MSENDLKTYFAVYTDFWKLFKKYSDPVDDDSFWESLVGEAEDIVGRYSGITLALRLATETCCEIRRIHEGKRDG